jgi:hypothetical protein
VAQHLIESMAQSNRDFKVISGLLQDGPVEPFTGMPVQEQPVLAPLDYTGFEVIADTRILDFRPWKVGSRDEEGRSWAYGYRCLRVRKVAPGANEFVVRVRAQASKGQARSLSDLYPAVLRSGRAPAFPDGKPAPVVDVAFDLSKVPPNEVVDLAFEFIGREPSPELLRSTAVYVDVKTSLLTCWLLLPEGKHYERMDLLRYRADNASVPERVVPARESVPPDGQIIGFSLLSLEPGYLYESRWTLRD